MRPQEPPKAAERQIELAHRPWIDVCIVPISNLSFENSGCVIHFNVEMTNVGHLVASKVSLWMEFAVEGVHDPNQVLKKLCTEMKKPQNQSSEYGWLLFPDKSATERRAVFVSPDDLKKALEIGPFKDVGAIGLKLVGCVDYPSPFDPKRRYQTRFTYLVSRADPARGNREIGAFYPIDGNYAGIIITPTMSGASAD